MRDLQVLSRFIQLKSVLLISSVFWIFVVFTFHARITSIVGSLDCPAGSKVQSHNAGTQMVVHIAYVMRMCSVSSCVGGEECSHYVHMFGHKVSFCKICHCLAPTNFVLSRTAVGFSVHGIQR